MNNDVTFQAEDPRACKLTPGKKNEYEYKCSG